MAGVAGSQPTNLKKPVPGQAEAAALAPEPSALPTIDFDEIESSLGEAAQNTMTNIEELPGTQVAAAEPEAIDFDAIEAEVDAGPVDENAELGTELKARFKAGFGGSTEQKAKIVAQTYGEENVEVDGDEIYVTRNGKKTKFTRDMWDMIGDLALTGLTTAVAGPFGPKLAKKVGLLEEDPTVNVAKDVADLGKPIISEAVALPFEAAGAAVGALGVNPATVAAGVAAGRVVGGAAGERVATAVGDMMGAEYAEGETEGQKLTRAGITGGVRAVFGLAADKVVKVVGNKAAARIADRTAARAKYLDAPTGEPGKIAQEAVGAAKEVADDIKLLSGSGLLGPIEGGNGAILLPHQANTAVPEFSEMAVAASQTNQFRNFLSAQGEQLSKAWKIVSKAGDDLAGKALEVAAKGADKQPGQVLSAADRAWGGTIGQYRKEAIANAGDQTFSTGRFRDALNETAIAAGFKPKPDGPTTMPDFSARVRPSADEVADKLSITKEQAQQFIDRMVKYHDRVYNSKGQMTLKEMDEMYNFLAVKTKDAFAKSDVSYSFRGAYKRMRDAVRDDFTDAMGAENVLGKESQAAYLAARERFSSVKNASEELSQLIETDNMSSKAISQYLFSGNKDSLDRIAALKPVLEAESPGAWNKVVNDWMGQLTTQYAAKGDKGKVIGGVNWKGLEKHLDGKPEVLAQVFGKEQGQKLMALVRVGRQIQEAGTGFNAKNEAALTNALFQNLPIIMKNPVFGVRLLKGMGVPEQSMAEMLSAGGRERMLKKVSEGNRGRMSKILDMVISDSSAETIKRAGGPTAQYLGRDVVAPMAQDYMSGAEDEE